MATLEAPPKPAPAPQPAQAANPNPAPPAPAAANAPAVIPAGFTSVKSVASPYLKFLVYGNSGVGKTYFGATGPKPVVFFDVDGGVLATTREMPGTILRETVNSQTELLAAIEKVRAQLQRQPGSIKMVVVDNLTELQRVLMWKAPANSLQLPETMPEHRDWGIVLRKMQAIINNMKSLPCHVMMTAHEDRPDGGKAMPAMSGQIRGQLPGWFDFVFRLMSTIEDKEVQGGGVIKVEKRVLVCRESTQSVAKNRGGKLGAMEDPNLNTIIAKVLGQ